MTRPLPVTLISYLLSAAGLIGLAYHATEFNAQQPFQFELVWILLVRLAAVVCGGYMLRGHDWARWLAVAWIGYHVILSSFHAWREFAIHLLLLAVFVAVLFHPGATRYFRRARAEAR